MGRFGQCRGLVVGEMGDASSRFPFPHSPAIPGQSTRSCFSKRKLNLNVALILLLLGWTLFSFAKEKDLKIKMATPTASGLQHPSWFAAACCSAALRGDKQQQTKSMRNQEEG